MNAQDALPAATQPAPQPATQPASPAQAIARLLDAGTSPNSKDELGVPLLCSAASAGQVDAVRLLLDRKADVNAADEPSGMTALHWAAAKDQPGAVAALLAGGADLAKTDRSGRTALHHAAAGSSPAVIKLLLDKKADPNAKDASGATPLHRAVRAGDAPCVQALLEAGADVNARSAGEVTPLHLALRAGRKDLADLLRAKGAKEVKLTRAEVPPIVRPAWLKARPAGGRPGDPAVAVAPTTRPAVAVAPATRPSVAVAPTTRPAVAAKVPPTTRPAVTDILPTTRPTVAANVLPTTRPAVANVLPTTRPAVAVHVEPTTRPAVATPLPAARPSGATLLFTASVKGTLRMGEQEQEVAPRQIGRFEGFKTGVVIEGEFTPEGGRAEKFRMMLPPIEAAAFRYGYVPAATPLRVEGRGAGLDAATSLRSSQAEVERAANIVAVVDALRNLSEKAVKGHCPQGPQTSRTKAVYGLPGLLVESQTEMKDFVVVQDVIRAHVPCRDRRLVIAARDFLLDPPKLLDDAEVMPALLQAAKTAGCQIQTRFSRDDMIATCTLQFHGPVLLYSHKSE